MTSKYLISHVCETRKFVMAILHRKQWLLCDKKQTITKLWIIETHFCQPVIPLSLSIDYLTTTVLTLSQTSSCFDVSFENSVGKGEIARYEQFLLFPQCFLPIWRTSCRFYQICNCRQQTRLEESKICRLERVNYNNNRNRSNYSYKTTCKYNKK